MSSGERQRTFLCRIFLQNAHWMLLDEPTTHLDFYFEEVLASLIQDTKSNITKRVFIASHNFNWLSKITHKFIILKKQKIHSVVDSRNLNCSLEDSIKALLIQK